MTGIRCSSIRLLFSAALCLAGSVYLLATGCSTAIAQEFHPVYVPVVFHAEARDIRTSACLQVNEHDYGPQKWWETASESNPASRAFREVISAIQKKDRGALLKLTDPDQAKDAKKFDEQADAFFQQFEKLEIVSAPQAFAFDGLAVFFAQFRSQRGSFFAPMVFAREKDGTFGFLPLRTRKATYQIVNDWFRSAWGPGGGKEAVYCPESEISQATHRASLISPEDEKLADRSFLLLKGGPIDGANGVAALADRVKAKIGRMSAALTAENIDQFATYMTAEGGGRLKEWFKSASAAERKEYEAAIVGQRPFFLFDLSSVAVVYLKPVAGPVQVMYFTFTNNNDPIWTNSSHVTVADTIFKTGHLYKSAQAEKPFSDVVSR